MKEKTDLYELIKSLNKNEKRYFRLYASMQKGKKNYLQLFDFLEKSGGYSKSELHKKYDKKKFMKHYSFNKNYLYKLIIKSLVNYNSENDIDNVIQSSISHCKILFRKALYKQYFRQVAAAKEKALKHERFGYYLQLLDMEKIIVKKEEIQSKKSDEIFGEAMNALDHYRTMFLLSRLAGMLLVNYREHGISREKRHEEIFNKVLGNPVMNSNSRLYSARASESYYRIKEIIAGSKGNFGELNRAQEERFKLIRSRPEPFKDYIINYYYDMLNSLFYSNLNLGNLEKCEEYLELYKTSLMNAGASEKTDFEILSSFSGLLLNVKKNNIKKAVSYIPKLENILVKYKNKLEIDTELSICFNIVKCRLLEKNYEKALKSANELINHPFIGKRADYELYLRLMMLIIHYELKNFSLLKYLIISAYRFLFKREKLYRLESLVIEFLRKLSDVKTQSDLEFTLLHYKKKLDKLKKDEYERNAFEYFDFSGWIAEKIK